MQGGMVRRSRVRPIGALAWCVTVPVTLAPGLVACQATPTDVYGGFFEDEAGSSSGGDAAPSGSEDDGSAEPDAASDSDDDEPAPTPPGLDVGAPVTDPEPPPACQAVDLLFVIDNSGSMGDEQLNLVASFPGFIEGIRDQLGPAASYHVGVATTDAYEWNVPMCQSLGGLTVRTGGDLSSAESCGPFASGQSFMTVADDLDDAFSCAAQVGIDGAGIERPMDALAGALTDPVGVNAACNDGFLRDDALLVVVLITDEEDEGDSLGQPIDWYQTVLDAKHGEQDQIVVLSLIGHDKPNECIPSQWTGMMGAEIAPRLRTFTELFDHGMVGDVCAADYAPFFEQAVDGIAEACGLVPTPAG